MAQQINSKIRKIETKVWATPRPGLTLAELQGKLVEAGNLVLEVDEVNNRILVAQEEREWASPK